MPRAHSPLPSHLLLTLAYCGPTAAGPQLIEYGEPEHELHLHLFLPGPAVGTDYVNGGYPAGSPTAPGKAKP